MCNINIMGQTIISYMIGTFVETVYIYSLNRLSVCHIADNLNFATRSLQYGSNRVLRFITSDNVHLIIMTDRDKTLNI